MTKVLFKKTILISLCGHLVLFSIFGLSFGNRIPAADYAHIYFWGQLLQNYEVARPVSPVKLKISLEDFFKHKSDTLIKVNLNKDLSTDALRLELKPAVPISLNTEKETITKNIEVLPPSPKKREATVIFHPLLPYSFNLYFKDRQVAHVELEFNKVVTPQRSYTIIKRKISSGNLEVDLLSMRYISHYLFIQKADLAPNSWQAVKIDLSSKND